MRVEWFPVSDDLTATLHILELPAYPQYTHPTAAMLYLPSTDIRSTFVSLVLH